jgi:hypothetical protein
MPVLRTLARRGCSRWGAAAWLFAGVACWLAVPIRVENGPSELDGAEITVRDRDGGVVLGSAPIRKGGAALWTFAAAPRPFALQVPGYAELPIVVHPVSPARYVLGRDVHANPTAVLRIGPDQIFLVNDARVQVVERTPGGEEVRAEAVLTDQSAAVVVGPGIPSSLDSWRRELTQSDVPESRRESLLRLWANPVRVPWKTHPSSPFASMRLRVITHSGAKWRSSQPLQLRGAITDVQVPLEASSR